MKFLRIVAKILVIDMRMLLWWCIIDVSSMSAFSEIVSFFLVFVCWLICKTTYNNRSLLLMPKEINVWWFWSNLLFQYNKIISGGFDVSASLREFMSELASASPSHWSWEKEIFVIEAYRLMHSHINYVKEAKEETSDLINKINLESSIKNKLWILLA